MGIGDELCVTGQCRILQQTDPRKVRIVYEKDRWHEIWDHNPRIAGRKENGDFQLLRPRDGWKRPYIAGKNEKTWTWQRWGPEWGGTAPRGELYFTAEELEFGERHAGLVIVEPHLKHGASQMKAWGWDPWQRLVTLLNKAGIRPVHVGASNIKSPNGADFLSTPSVRMAAAVIARARFVIVPEGALHHIAAAVGARAVVLFGGYIAPEVTGYPEQLSIFTGGPEHPLGCGMRIPCLHCKTAWAKIDPEMVVARALDMIGAEA